jgi:hypothetical protein
MELLAHTWYELLQHIKKLRGELGNPDELWFRGHGNAKYVLLPSLLRFRNGLDKEKFLFEKFRQLSLKVFPRRTDDWETLFDMQHYGIPTRLLDWTDTLGIAVFFAATYNAQFYRGSDAAIFLLDPIALNGYSRIGRVPLIPDDKDLNYRDIYWAKKPFAPNFPIACEPVFLNDRILAQKGKFTIHGDDTTAVEVLCDKAVKRIVLTGKSIPEALEFLEIANINEYTVFPDMSGIADYVRRSAGLK